MIYLIALLIAVCLLAYALHRRPWPAKEWQCLDGDPDRFADGGSFDSGPLEDVNGLIASDAEPVVNDSLTTDAFTLRPDWSKAPEWVRYQTQDGDGTLRQHEFGPKQYPAVRWSGGYWFDADGRTDYVDFGRGPANPNWREAIEQRPEPLRERIAGMMEGSRENVAVTDEEVARQFLSAMHSPERDDNQLISRVELERLRGIEYAARAFRNSKSPAAYVKMCDAMGELP